MNSQALQPLRRPMLAVLVLAVLALPGIVFAGQNDPVISGVIINYSGNTIAIAGANFTSVASITLGATPLIPQTSTATLIGAAFPPASPAAAMAGTYLLKIVFQSPNG